MFFLSVCFLCVFSARIYAEASEDDEVVVLTQVEVSALRDAPEIVTRDEMDRAGARDLWESVQDVPGVLLSGGGRRNDSNFTVRGYGADSVPIYVDGVLAANPFRGEGDSARILTGDLESIEIKKGYSSQLLGANALGGAVLMRIAKPKKPLELLSRTTLDLDGLFGYGGISTVARAGTRQDLFYAMGTLQYRNTDHFRLSEKFEPYPGSIQEKGERLWSDSKDTRATLMAGITPTPDLDIWTTYIYQNADKGVSPPDTGGSYDIWNWPFWRRHTASINGAYTGERLSMSGLLYFDKYDNRLEEYYSKKAFELGIHAPWSDYDEYSLGGRFTGEYIFTEARSLAAALTWKLDDHRGLRGTILNTDMREVMHAKEIILSGGTEYSERPFRIPLTLKAGFGLDTLAPLAYWSMDNEFAQLMQSGYYIAQTRNMLLYTWQAGLFWQIAEHHEGRLTYARKNHFPTMSQRYSTRFGTTLPNPNLGPEQANHFELGYRGALFADRLHIAAAAYYSIIRGKMATVEIPNPENPNALTDYTFNLDSTSFYGFELAPELFMHDYCRMGLSLSAMRYTIHHREAGGEYLPYSPQLTVNGYMIIRPGLQAVSVIPRWEYTGVRYNDMLGDEKLPGYFLLHLKIQIDIGSSVSVAAGVNNILDIFYERRRYSPQEGRSFHCTIEGRY
ncbi:MAG: TonB-dependent receptor [Spirochaetota bacterium]|nr:TonB-dependent receptor [Spirochaetota bacterium]